MTKKVKLLILMLSIPITYFIYILNNNKNINYIALGDDLSVGINSFGIANYSYSDYIKDYIRENNMLNIYTNKLSERNKTITEEYNDILVNKKVKIDNKTYNIKKLLRESDILTISLGQNDIRYEISSTNKQKLTSRDYTQIAETIFTKYKTLITEIKKYFKRDLYLLGTYYRTETERNISQQLNKKLKEYCNDNKMTFIDISYIGNDKYFDNRNSNLPNDEAYLEISKSIISRLILEK